MRADSQRKYERLVQVASDVFAEQGYDASLNEIAKRAGVGPGTLYRHFPTRDSLLDACMKNWTETIQAAAARAVASDLPPRDMLVEWLEAFLAHIRLYRGGPSRLIASMRDPASAIYPKLEILASANETVLEKLRTDDALSRPFESMLLCQLVGGIGSVADAAELDSATVRALLEFIADGLLRPEEQGSR